MSKMRLAGISVGVIVIVGLFAWAATAPYLSNQGLGRTPGIIIGGELTPPMDDFSPLNEYQGPMIFKLEGFPPFVNYLSFVGTPEGIISATRPDGGYWGERVRGGNNKGWLRIGDETFAMEATEIFGDERIAMMEQWAGRSGRTLDEPLYEGSEPLREWEVYFWTPR